jgi:hypothetical protein
LRFEIEQKLVGKPLYIILHAFNESHEEDCMQVYLEIEFSHASDGTLKDEFTDVRDIYREDTIKVYESGVDKKSSS